MRKNNIKRRLEKTFLELINIDEVYGQEKEIVNYVVGRLKKKKLPYKIDKFGNVVGYLGGKGKPVLLNTHLDIPENVSNLAYETRGNIINATGKSILGADPKSGLAVLIELADYIKDKEITTHPVEFVFTLGEEAGLLGAINLDYSLLKSKMGLVVDEDGPCTNIVTKAPGYYRIDAEFIGKTAHSRDWREGKNSLEAACKAISKLKQGEIVNGVTFNIGLMRAGTARNSIPGTTQLKAELRSFDLVKLKNQGKRVEKTFKEIAKGSGVKVKIMSKIEFESYNLQRNHSLFLRLEKTFKKLDLKPNYYETFGGSDANIFNVKGIKAVPIGSAYYLAHRYNEYVDLEEMKRLFSFLVNFVEV